MWRDLRRYPGMVGILAVIPSLVAFGLLLQFGGTWWTAGLAWLAAIWGVALFHWGTRP